MSDETEPTRTTDETGREILVYPYGMIKDANTGHIITPSKRWQFDSETGIAARQRRFELARLAAMEGLAEGFAETLKKPIRDWGDADTIRTLFRLTAARFAESKNLRGMGETLSTIIRLADLAPERGGAAGGNTNNITVNAMITTDLLEALRDVLTEAGLYKGGEIIDAETGP